VNKTLHLQSFKEWTTRPLPTWYRKGVARLWKKRQTISKECSLCKREVGVMVYECSNFKSKFCPTCANNNEWKCPNCRQKLGLAELDS
jgi:transcription initiation factor IIE alpha subunit